MEVGTYEGKDVEAAIQKGLADQNVTLDDVHVKIIQEPRKGFLGLGERAAVVSLVPKDVVTDVAEEVVVDKPIEDIETTAATATVSNGAVDTAGAEVQSVEDMTTETVNETESTDSDDGDSLYDVDDVAHYIINVLEKYGVDHARVEVVDEDDELIYQIITDKPGLVIGKHGKIINALEVLVQVMTHRYVRSGVYVSVDVDDYRERRYGILEKLAKRVAHEVMEDHETVYLDPLPAGERKIVHHLLAQYPSIKTHSEGREPYRYLVASYQSSHR